MTAILNQKILPCLLSLLLIVATMPEAVGQDQQAAPSSGPTGQGAPETA